MMPDGTIDSNDMCSQAVVERVLGDDSVTSIKIFANLQSDNYDGGVIASDSGTVGWRIERNTGDAVFSNVIIRGILEASIFRTADTSSDRFQIVPTGGFARVLQWIKGASTVQHSISGVIDSNLDITSFTGSINISPAAAGGTVTIFRNTTISLGTFNVPDGDVAFGQALEVLDRLTVGSAGNLGDIAVTSSDGDSIIIQPNGTAGYDVAFSGDDDATRKTLRFFGSSTDILDVDILDGDLDVTAGDITSSVFQADATASVLKGDDGSSGLVEYFPKNYISAATSQTTSHNFTTTETKFGEVTVACEYNNQPVLVEMHVWARAAIQAGNAVWIRPGINGTAQGSQTPINGNPSAPTATQGDHFHTHNHPVKSVAANSGGASAGAPHTHTPGTYSVNPDSQNSDTKTAGAITVTAGAAQNVVTATSWIAEATADGSGDVKVSAHVRLSSGSFATGVVQVAYKISRR